MYSAKALFCVTVVVFVVFVENTPANLVTNGGFEAGNAGVVSDYEYWDSEQDDENQPEGYYSLDDNPHDVHTKWSDMGDHTTGSGLMLIANGATESNKAVWKQDVTLTKGVSYDFSAWATGVYLTNPACLEFRVGDASLGQLELEGGYPAWKPSWQEFSASFEAVTTGSTTLAAYDLVELKLGNDFALDDITLIPEPSSLILASVLFLGIVAYSRWRI